MASPSMSLDLTSEEMSELIDDVDQTTAAVLPSSNRGASKGYTTEPTLDELKRKIEILERDIEKFKKQKKKSHFDWFKVEKYTRMDIVSATKYVVESIAPQVNCLIESNRKPLEPILVFTRIASKTKLRTCTNFNLGNRCNLRSADTRDCHLDALTHRIHCCQLCWECLRIFSPHRILECPLINEDFWQNMSQA